MKLKAYAKINPALFVTGRRPDGYHEVDMIMQTISLCDEVTVELFKGPGIRLTMNTEDLPTDERNIAYRAAVLMLSEYKNRSADRVSDNEDEEILPGIRIHIDKHIPVAAGMAGGSTDCAAVIKALNVILGLNLSTQELINIGVKLGADVPFCIEGGTMRSRGIGEILTRVSPLPQCYILTAKPDYSVSTREVYEGIDAKTEVHEDPADYSCIKKIKTQEPQLTEEDKTDHSICTIDSILKGFNNGDLTEISGSLYNDLEKYTIRIHPDLEDLKKTMLSEGALGALMSGSGPTVFGIFKDLKTAEEAKKHIHLLDPESIVNISRPVND